MITINSLISGERRRWVTLAVVCMGQLMMVLDATIVNVALPSMQRDLGFSQANLAWVIDAYLIAFGSFLLLGGRLGDLFGRKRMFLGGLVLFTLASAACGLSDSQVLLIVARFIQGLGGAVASAAVLALLVTEFPKPAERAIAMSVYTFIVSSGGSIGLLAGGVLTQSLSWHWIFFINLPIGIVTFALGRALISETERTGRGQGIDVLGAVLVTVSLMLGVYAIVKVTEYGWVSAHTLGFGGVSLALLAAFVAVESRVANPMFPLRILRVPGLAASSVVRAFLVTGMFSTFLLGVLYLQHVHGYGALETGLAFLPLTLIMGVMSLGVTARLMGRFGPLRVLLVGLAAIAASLVLLSQTAGPRELLPDDRRPVRAARLRRRAVVPAADDDGDGERAAGGRRPGLRDRQRVVADLGGDRDRGAGDGGGAADQGADRRRTAPVAGTHRRLSPCLGDRRRHGRWSAR